jgi:hypothetical protein
MALCTVKKTSIHRFQNILWTILIAVTNLKVINKYTFFQYNSNQLPEQESRANYRFMSVQYNSLYETQNFTDFIKESFFVQKFHIKCGHNYEQLPLHETHINVMIIVENVKKIKLLWHTESFVKM